MIKAPLVLNYPFSISSMAIQIHGKQYVTVDERVKAAHEACKSLSITTEVLPIAHKIVVKATVITEKGTFTGISAANEAKSIEKQSPYEVAETSAVGRALGFAGYGVVNGIATVEEIAKTRMQGSLGGSTAPASVPVSEAKDATPYCNIHRTAMKDRGKGVWDHRLPGTLDKHGKLVRNEKGVWYWCQGSGWHVAAT
jgi:hypothetical protein